MYYSSKKEKFELMKKLEQKGIVQKTAPNPGITCYRVRIPDLLPSCLKQEFATIGEIRV